MKILMVCLCSLVLFGCGSNLQMDDEILLVTKMEEWHPLFDYKPGVCIYRIEGNAGYPFEMMKIDFCNCGLKVGDTIQIIKK